MKKILSGNENPLYISFVKRNKTERLYFNHFKDRKAPYNLYIENCEATDIIHIAQKAMKIYKQSQLDLELGDKVYCLIDLDLDQDKYQKYICAKNKYKKIEIIPSNPCFEIWLLYYFTENPKVVSSSQHVKEQMTKFIPDYTESTNVISVASLNDKHAIAINNSEKKNNCYLNSQSEVERNPYTEVAIVVSELLSRQHNQ